MNKPKCICIDIDGCLGDSTEMVETCFEDGKFNREKANKLVPNMPVNPWADAIAHNMYLTYDIIILTARRDSIRDITEKWLDDNHILHEGVCMKPEGSKMKDEEYKLDMLKTLEEKYEIVFMVEDAPKTVKLLRENGYIVLQPNNLYPESI